jgi:hypothetical protein
MDPQPSSEDDEKREDSGGKTPCLSPFVQPQISRAHAAMRGISGKRPIKAFLTYYKKNLGGAATAFATTFPLQPNLDSSWSSWQAVFDECKVLSAVIHWKVSYAAAGVAAPAQTPNAVMVYDPTDASAFTSLNQALEYEDYQLCSLGNTPLTVAIPSVFIQAVSSGKAPGFATFHSVCPKGTQFSNADTSLSTGIWRPTQDAGNYYWGNFQSYCSAGGTTSQFQVEAFVRLVVEFRTRR